MQALWGQSLEDVLPMHDYRNSAIKLPSVGLCPQLTLLWHSFNVCFFLPGTTLLACVGRSLLSRDRPSKTLSHTPAPCWGTCRATWISVPSPQPLLLATRTLGQAGVMIGWRSGLGDIMTTWMTDFHINSLQTLLYFLTTHQTRR